MCPHTDIYVSTYRYILSTYRYQPRGSLQAADSEHTALYVSAYRYICVHIPIYVSAYRYQPQVAQKAVGVALGDHLDPGLFTIEACPPSLDRALIAS